MLIVACSHGNHLGRKIARKLRCRHSELLVDKFPDDELKVKFSTGLDNERVVLVQSFYKNISDCIVESVFAARTAKELKAKKVILVAPYFPYTRQDKRFNPGEAISQRIIAELFSSYFDEIVIMDPHLHRTRKLDDIFSAKTKKITAVTLIADYIKKNIENPVIIGPDAESYKWARNVAEILKVESRILKKKRYSSYHVEVKLNRKIDLKKKNAVIVDDIVSTGHTILETAKILRRLGAKKIYCICVHGIFAGNALSKLRKAGIQVVSTNTIPSTVAKIDVSVLISGGLKPA